LDLVDDDNFDGGFRRFQLQPRFAAGKPGRLFEGSFETALTVNIDVTHKRK
jgi:hypothetical protein